MTFSEALVLVAGRLLLERRVTYRRMRNEFGIDGELLEDVRHEFLFRRVAVDEDGQGLAATTTWWADSREITSPAEALPSGVEPPRAPLRVPAQALPGNIKTQSLCEKVSPGRMKTKFSCEKGRNLDQHRVEAQIDDGLMTCRYLMGLRLRALIRYT